jgi:hypothetical protein
VVKIADRKQSVCGDELAGVREQSGGVGGCLPDILARIWRWKEGRGRRGICMLAGAKTVRPDHTSARRRRGVSEGGSVICDLVDEVKERNGVIWRARRGLSAGA